MLKSLDDPRTAGLILEEQANALKSILGDASVLKLVRVRSLLIYLFIYLLGRLSNRMGTSVDDGARKYY